jgi:hypothetical protein
MKKLFKPFIIALFAIALISAPAMACDGPNCSASGNFGISTLAAGGGVDGDLNFIPNGIAGGISGAGGVSQGLAGGEISSFKFFGHTFTLGSASGELDSVGGGVTNTHDYTYHPDLGDVSIGLGSTSDSWATTEGHLNVQAKGVAGAAGEISGIAGEGSLNGSLIGPSPSFGWESKGFSGGVAGQGAIGGFAGFGATGLYGESDVAAGVTMDGQSYSESYRAIDWHDGKTTEYMGTNVGAFTNVTSYRDVDNSCFAIGAVDGGYVAGGFAGAITHQSVDGGVANATAFGSYQGAGELGCSFSGSAEGYTSTNITTVPNYQGSVVGSHAGMSVSVGHAVD